MEYPSQPGSEKTMLESVVGYGKGDRVKIKGEGKMSGGEHRKKQTPAIKKEKSGKRNVHGMIGRGVKKEKKGIKKKGGLKRGTEGRGQKTDRCPLRRERVSRDRGDNLGKRG